VKNDAKETLLSLKTVPSGMWKAHYSLSDRLSWAFHISPGKVQFSITAKF
jgi:hypothetical protein